MAYSQAAKHHIWLKWALIALGCKTELEPSCHYIHSALSYDNLGTFISSMPL